MSQDSNRLSSNFTILYAIAIPIFWFIFFGSLSFASFVIPYFNPEVRDPGVVKYVSLLLFVLGIIFYFLFSSKLKRLDINEEGLLFFTNYFKTIKMPIQNIKNVRIFDFYVMRIAVFNLFNRGVFGQRIIVMERENLIEQFVEENQIKLVNRK